MRECRVAQEDEFVCLSAHKKRNVDVKKEKPCTNKNINQNDPKTA